MRRGWTAAFAMGVALSPRGAEALCFAPEDPQIVWSYPGDGDVVPSNLERVFVRGDSSKDVFLNSAPLERSSAGGYALPPLDPGTSYELIVEMFANTFGDAGRVESTVRRTIAFQTDAGPLMDPPPEAPVVIGHAVTQGLGYGTCATILGTGGCFDTGEPMRLSFVVEGSAFIWQVEGLGTLPAAACDGPAIVGGEEDDLLAGCYVVNAIDRAGRATSSSSYCPGAAPDSGVRETAASSGSSDAGGCTLTRRSSTSAGASLAFSLLLLAARRRRSGRLEAPSSMMPPA